MKLFSTSLLLIGSFLLQSTAHAQVNSIRQEFMIQPPEEKFTSDRKYYGDMAFTLFGRRFDDPFANSRYGRAQVEATLGAKYSNWLEGKLAVSQTMTSGASSNLLGVKEGGANGNGLGLDEATINVMPTTWVKGSAGILQVRLSPIFSQYNIQAQAGGAVEFSHSVTYKDDITFKASLLGSQSIPTAGAAGDIIADQDTNPLLTVATAFGEFENKYTGTRLRASASHFEFTDLSSTAASDSMKIGSSTFAKVFLYEFRGKEFAGSIKQKIGLSHALELRASTIKNERAPASLNEGSQARIDYTRSFDKWEISPYYTQFRMEGDALPATYAIGSMGFTNREGYVVGMKFNMPKEKFNVFGSYTNAKAIREAGLVQTNTNTSTYQADREVFTLGAEVQYDIF